MTVFVTKKAFSQIFSIKKKDCSMFPIDMINRYYSSQVSDSWDAWLLDWNTWMLFGICICNVNIILQRTGTLAHDPSSPFSLGVVAGKFNPTSVRETSIILALSVDLMIYHITFSSWSFPCFAFAHKCRKLVFLLKKTNQTKAIKKKHYKYNKPGKIDERNSKIYNIAAELGLKLLINLYTAWPHHFLVNIKTETNLHSL